MINAVGFDVGHTLIKYNNPLNWSALYRPAFEKVLKRCNFELCDNNLNNAITVLRKYNTRENYREYEVSSDQIFSEILNVWEKDISLLDVAKETFYSFFRADAVPFDEAKSLLSELNERNIKVGVLTDVPYGMDNKFALNDFGMLSKYIDIAFTSTDVGYRKPNVTGFKMLVDSLNVEPSEMLFVGDEEKDIVGANTLGIGSVLINRGNEDVNFGQKYTINSLNEIISIL